MHLQDDSMSLFQHVHMLASMKLAGVSDDIADIRGQVTENPI